MRQREKTEMVTLRASPEFMELVDDFRRHETDIPTRAEAIRRLVTRGFLNDRSTIDDLTTILIKAHRAGEIGDARWQQAVEVLGRYARRAAEMRRQTGLDVLEPGSPVLRVVGQDDAD